MILIVRRVGRFSSDFYFNKKITDIKFISNFFNYFNNNNNNNLIEINVLYLIGKNALYKVRKESIIIKKELENNERIKRLKQLREDENKRHEMELAKMNNDYELKKKQLDEIFIENRNRHEEEMAKINNEKEMILMGMENKQLMKKFKKKHEIIFFKRILKNKYHFKRKKNENKIYKNGFKKNYK